MKNVHGKVVLSSPVTHIDWMANYYPQDITHGIPSVRTILDRCKAVGWTRLYWRCLDGGLANYKSKIMDGEEAGVDPDNYHAWMNPGVPVKDVFRQYRRFDALKEAVAYGHKIGLEIHAWLSINEDDHAWGIISRFSRAHPEYRWVKRSGDPYNSQLSFAFPDVQEYKLQIVKEVLAYDIDGVFFDWIRTGDVRNNPQSTPDGTADFGYEKPLVEGFKKKYGIDPRTIPNSDKRWVQFRCEPQTAFMRQAHKLIKRKRKNLPIAVMGQHPWGYRGNKTPVNGCFYGLLLDVAQWAKEGLIDEVVAAGYYLKGGTPEKAFRYMKDLVKGRCKVWTYAWVTKSIPEFQEDIRLAEKAGATQILFWESDYIGLPGTKSDVGEVTKVMEEYAR